MHSQCKYLIMKLLVDLVDKFRNFVKVYQQKRYMINVTRFAVFWFGHVFTKFTVFHKPHLWKQFQLMNLVQLPHRFTPMLVSMTNQNNFRDFFYDKMNKIGVCPNGTNTPSATNSSFSKSTSKSRSRPLGKKYWYQHKGLVTGNRYV